jgi:arsenate reductase (thioredoxin)
MNDGPIAVLFVSRDNGARSQMAEAFLRELGGDAFEAYSVGSVAHEIHPLAIAAMAERGIDISHQRSKGLDEYLGSRRFDYLITVCDRHEQGCPMFPGRGTHEYWPFEDPARSEATDAERLAGFRVVRDEIEARVVAWLTRLSGKPGRGVKREHTPVSQE